MANVESEEPQNLPSQAWVIDIDGVLVHGESAIEKAGDALKMLQTNKIPHVFLTNGFGKADAKAHMLNTALRTNIKEEEIIMVQTPIQALFDPGQELENKRCLFIGPSFDGGVARIAPDLGCTKFYTVEDLRRIFPYLDNVDREFWPREGLEIPDQTTNFEPVDAIVICSEPKQWESSLQLILDCILGEGCPNERKPYYPNIKKQIPVYVINLDLYWKAKAPMPRFGNGAFLICLEALFKKFTGRDLKYTKMFGKPSKFSYEFALKKIKDLYPENNITSVIGIGDNPRSDITGCNNMKSILPSGVTATSILVKTGCYKDGDILGKQKSNDKINHAHRDFPTLDSTPDLIKDSFYQAVVDEIEKTEK